jgi:hypothetical protein
MAATIELPGVDFAALAKEVISVKLTEALATSDDGIKKIVHAALGVRVLEETGNTPRYSSDKTVPWVEYVAADMVRAATKEVLKAKVESLMPTIQKAVEAELKRSSKTIAHALVGAFTESCKNGYRLSVQMQYKTD